MISKTDYMFYKNGIQIKKPFFTYVKTSILKFFIQFKNYLKFLFVWYVGDESHCDTVVATWSHTWLAEIYLLIKIKSNSEMHFPLSYSSFHLATM